MKKIFFAGFLFIALMSCNGSTAEKSSADTLGRTDGGVTDTTHAADGTINSSAISTDTAAMNTGRAMEKKDSAEKK